MNKTTQKTNPKSREPDDSAPVLSHLPEGRPDTNAAEPGQPPERRGSERKEGSPTTRPCTNIGSSETADEESPAEMIPVVDGGGGADENGKMVTVRSVPLYLIAPVLSREIHTYRGAVSEVFIRRTGQHRYLITLLTRPRVTHAGVTHPRATSFNAEVTDAD